jgi:tetratricopeptide (TPR) repeat protein
MIMICPLCATRVPVDVDSCPGGGTGLRESAVAAYLPAWLYNEALVRLRRHQWGEAADRFAQAALFWPGDVDLLRGWATALAQSGQPEQALDKLSQAAELGADVQAEIGQLVRLLTPPPPPVVRRARRPYAASRRPSYWAQGKSSAWRHLRVRTEGKTDEPF